MVKTIKRVKEMRLDELIKYVWDNDVKGKSYSPIDSGYQVEVDGVGALFFSSMASYRKCAIYAVEVEEEITEDTEFEKLIWFDLKGDMYISRESSIAKIRSYNDLCKKIYVYHNDKFIEIWERDADE